VAVPGAHGADPDLRAIIDSAGWGTSRDRCFMVEIGVVQPHRRQLGLGDPAAGRWSINLALPDAAASQMKSDAEDARALAAAAQVTIRKKYKKLQFCEDPRKAD